MPRDYAKLARSRRRSSNSRSNNSRGKPANRRRSDKSRAAATGGSFRAYLAGLLSGLFAAFVIYLATLPPAEPLTPEVSVAAVEPELPPKPNFDFYDRLRKQRVAVEAPPVEPAAVSQAPADASAKPVVYILQTGSFRQREDADRRRAELLLLGLEPGIEETRGDSGRWFRVHVGPFDSHAAMSRARGLVRGQGIETLLLKRPAG